MASIVQLKRSALTGKVPGTGSLNLGELALNTYDGKIFFRRSGSTDTIQEVVTTNVLNTGSVSITTVSGSAGATTLTTPQIPSHAHRVTSPGTATGSPTFFSTFTNPAIPDAPSGNQVHKVKISQTLYFITL